MQVSLFTPADYPSAIVEAAHRQSPTGARTPGLHLTDIIRDLVTTAGIGRDNSAFDQDSLDWFACGGWLWERVWDMAHQELIERGDIAQIGEIELDGIIATPDRVDFTRPAVIELKCRWMAMWKFEQLEKYFWAELLQVKSYCHMLNITEADLVVFFVAGNWRPPVPDVKGARLTFTEEELAESWRQVVGHAQARGWL